MYFFRPVGVIVTVQYPASYLFPYLDNAIFGRVVRDQKTQVPQLPALFVKNSLQPRRIPARAVNLRKGLLVRPARGEVPHQVRKSIVVQFADSPQVEQPHVLDVGIIKQAIYVDKVYLAVRSVLRAPVVVSHFPAHDAGHAQLNKRDNIQFFDLVEFVTGLQGVGQHVAQLLIVPRAGVDDRLRGRVNHVADDVF